jgi:hypothetical protein
MPGTSPRLSGSGFSRGKPRLFHRSSGPLHVMAVLVTAIHALRSCKKDVDARHKAGHDDLEVSRTSTLATGFAQPDSRGTSPRMTV